MINIKSNNDQQISFSITIEGANEKDINGKLRLIKEGVEYGFPIHIHSDQVFVNIPALDTVIPNLKDGDILEAKMEIVANNEYFTNAWNDKIKIEKPVKATAMVTESVSNRPQITVQPKVTVNKPIKEGEKKLQKKSKTVSRTYPTTNISKQVDESIETFIDEILL